MENKNCCQLLEHRVCAFINDCRMLMLKMNKQLTIKFSRRKKPRPLKSDVRRRIDTDNEASASTGNPMTPGTMIFRKPEHENHLLEDLCHDISG